ncbi:MAG: thermonuclease family protein [Leptolyngbya sp.]|nr:thermonuclease family protein [Leptolyngbya sp.]
MTNGLSRLPWTWGRSRLLHPWLNRGFGVLVGLIMGLGLWIGATPGQAPDPLAVAVAYAPSGQSLQLLYPVALPPQGTPVEAVRLTGITAPDRDQVPWGPAAQDCLNQRVRDQNLRLEAANPEADAYGRLWAYAWLGDRLINQELLEAGCAYLDQATLLHHPEPETWIYAQEQARLLGLGLWNPEQPLRQSPDAFRQAQNAG